VVTGRLSLGAEEVPFGGRVLRPFDHDPNASDMAQTRLRIQSSLGEMEMQRGVVTMPHQPGSWECLGEQASSEMDSTKVNEFASEPNRVLGEREGISRQKSGACAGESRSPYESPRAYSRRVQSAPAAHA
jgi:hypothetical protein